MASSVLKAVIPVAGYGTRFLPATKATPKEMLPVVDKPAIQYVVEEAVAAGLLDLLFVTGRTKRALEDHFDDNPELEAALGNKDKTNLLEAVRHPAGLAAVHYVRQGTPKGLGDAVLRGKEHVGDNPFAVLLGDDLIDDRDYVLPKMIETQQKFGGSVVLLMEVPENEISLYGCAQVKATDDSQVVQITDLVEKPEIKNAPSNLAVIGRYIFSPKVFEILEQTKPGKGGEVQLTDAMTILAKEVTPADGGGMYGVIFKGRRYDTGDKLAYLQAVVQLAVERNDLGPDFKKWLKTFAETLN
ncbi:MAG: UTP--glucose-1-phosphate uridylyltransferase GalU [Candidatus Nanopelagicales bacterium]